MDSPATPNTVICSNAKDCPLSPVGCCHGRPHAARKWTPKGSEEKITCTSPGDCHCKTGKKIELLHDIKCVKFKEGSHE